MRTPMNLARVVGAFTACAASVTLGLVLVWAMIRPGSVAAATTAELAIVLLLLVLPLPTALLAARAPSRHHAPDAA